MYSSRGLRRVFVYRVNMLLKLHIISTVRIDAPHYHKTKSDNTSHERETKLVNVSNLILQNMQHQSQTLKPITFIASRKQKLKRSMIPL